MIPLQPLAIAEQSVAQETINTADFLSKMRTDDKARALLSKGALSQLDATVPGGTTPILVLDAVKAEAAKPGGNLTGACLQAFGMIHAVLTDLEAACKTTPALAGESGVIAAIQQYKNLQAAGATLQLQKCQLELADKTLVLAKELYDIVDLVPDQQYVTTKSGKSRLESINKAFKDALANLADHLSRARIMAQDTNVFGAAFEVMNLSNQVEGFVTERWKTITKTPNLNTQYTADKSKIDALLLKLPGERTAVYKASADYHAARQQISNQPHQVAVTVKQASGSFAQQIVTHVAMCQETKNHLDSVAMHEANMYQEVENWFYQSLRLQTPSTQRKKDVNVGHTPGKTADPIVTTIIPKGKLEADHIVSMKIISQHPDYAYLTTADKLGILNRADNFTGLSRSPNASKSDRSYADWKTYLSLDTKGIIGVGSMQGETVNIPHLDSLIKLEQTLRPVIEADIMTIASQRKQEVRDEYPV